MSFSFPCRNVDITFETFFPMQEFQLAKYVKSWMEMEIQKGPLCFHVIVYVVVS